MVERLRSTLETLTPDQDVVAALPCVDGVASVVVPQHARYADLCILGQDQPEGISSVGYTFAEQMLFVTGRPVLFVPPVGSFKTLGRHIVVAWNSRRPAARAINDAVPLIERADRTTVLMINPSGFIDPHHALPEELIVEHLRRHGVSADAARIDDVPPQSIADTLQSKAHALGADLIVAGVFGHPRLREKLLGGVT